MFEVSGLSCEAMPTRQQDESISLTDHSKQILDLVDITTAARAYD